MLLIQLSLLLSRFQKFVLSQFMWKKQNSEIYILFIQLTAQKEVWNLLTIETLHNLHIRRRDRLDFA